MPQFSLTVSGYGHTLQGIGSVAAYDVILEVTSISGAGGYSSPHLQLNPWFGSRTIREGVRLVPFELWAELHLGQSSTAGSPQTMVSRTTRSATSLIAGNPTTLSFPLSAESIARIEESRNGADLDLSLHLQVAVAVHTVSTPHSELKDIDQISGNVGFRVPRSHWVDQVLPNVGYLTKYVIEMDVPSSNELTTSSEALRRSGVGLYAC